MSLVLSHNRIVQALQLERACHVARVANDEQIANSAIENNFRRNSRIGAGKDRRGRMLTANKLFAPGRIPV
jgi:hypothetical protein